MKNIWGLKSTQSRIKIHTELHVKLANYNAHYSHESRLFAWVILSDGVDSLL